MNTEYQFSIFLTGIPLISNNLNLIIELPVLLLLLAGSAAMSAAETAYLSLKPDDLRSLRATNNNRSKKAVRLHGNPETLLATILVSNNIINIAFIFVSALVCIRIFGFNPDKLAGFLAVMSVLTLILLLAGEILPKYFATGKRVSIVVSMAPFLSAAQIFLKPVLSLIVISPVFLRRKIESDYQNDTGLLTVNEDEKILRGIANFGNTNVSAIMVPRIAVTSIDIKSSFDKIIPVIINSGFSRIPVYSGSFDSVKGILYAKDVLPFRNNPANFKWQSLLRPSYFVPETKKINDLLKEFQIRKIHMAIVIDEYGGTSGIVTLEDILEEIVGDITDESDEEETMFHRVDETKYIFEGRILLQDFCKVFGIDEDFFGEVRGETETLAGLILELTGEIPQKDQELKYKNFVFRIEAVDKRRIREILVERININDEAEK